MSYQKIIAMLLAILMLVALFSSCDLLTPPSGENPPNGGTSPCAHTDTDDNGKCDVCTVNVIVMFDFFAINDLHGKICDTDTQPGVDELSTYLKNRYAANPNTIVVSAGDMWQGSAESNLTRGFLTTEWMNELDFAAMALGNHEYDWGSDYIEQNDAVAEFPLLAINVYDRSTNAPVSYCAPSVLVDKGAVQIGIIGAIGDCYSSISGDKVQDVYFKVGEELTALVKAESEELREAGADFIVYVLHDGYEQSRDFANVQDAQIASYYDASLSDGYVDLVFEGHTHQRYVLQDRHGVYHLQNGGDNRNGISHARVAINMANGNTRVEEASGISASSYTHLVDDPIVENLLEKYKDEIAVADRTLGNNSTYRDGDTLRALLARLYLEAGVEQWGDSYDIVLGGAYFSVRSPGYLAVGEVVYADLQTLFPFDNQIELCTIRGDKLLSQFIYSTNENYFIHYSSYGDGIKNAIDPTETYYIITDTYSSTFAPNGLTKVDSLGEGIYARDLLADHIGSGGLDATVNQQGGLSTIPEILAEGNRMEDNAVTDAFFCVLGRIVDVYNTKYGNMIIQDDAGNRLTIYGTYDVDGNRYDAMEEPPVVGDTVVLTGPIKRYVNGDTVIIELMDVVYQKFASIPEIIAIGNDIPDNHVTLEIFCVLGTVVEVTNTTYGNMVIEDAAGNRLVIYGAYTADGTRYDGMADPPTVGDEVLLLGPVQRYVKKDGTVIIELVDAQVRS